MSEAERDFLDDDATEIEEQETPETPEPETPEPVAETVETPAQPEPEAPTAPEVKEEHSVPYAAMKAEREKRQRLERELDELRQQHSAPKAEPVNFYEDPDAFMQQHVQTIEQRATQRLYMALEAQAREVHPDYDEVFEEVKAHAASNPAVGQQILSAPNPALAAYKLGKQLRELKQMEDPIAYREKVRAELRAELEAEQAAKQAAKAKAAASIPPDLTESRNAKGQFTPAPETVFDEIFS